MGITGLLPFLEKSSRKTNIDQFAGGTVAIDSYCWLHRGAFSCADKLSMGVQTDAYVHYCMKFVNMLLSHNIKPILVFDGRHLPAKAHTEAKRREARQLNKRKAIELMRMGQDAEGRNLLRRSLDISHEMALELIKHCQKKNIDCIVAPYEADAQLAYLNITGIADVVITEDSDLILFGCNKVFFKMDVIGNGTLIDQERIYLAMGQQSEHFDIDAFRNMCILSGCDYLPSLPGIGLGKARKFIMKNGDSDIHRALTRLGSCLNMKSLNVTKEYRDAFVLAIITFKHQLVFCPLKRKQVRLNSPTPDITEEQLIYAGKETDPDTAFQLALGNCDPFTFKMLHDFDPDNIQNQQNGAGTWGNKTKHISIWSKNYQLKRHKVEESPKRSWFQIAGKEMNLLTNPLKRVKLVKEPDDLECKELSNEEMLNTYQRLNITETENSSEVEGIVEEGRMSPILSIKRNPFSQSTHHKMSPSLVSRSRNRIRGRNLLRIRRTVVDETVSTESQFFTQPLTEKNTNVMTDEITPSSRSSMDEASKEKEEADIEKRNETNNVNLKQLTESCDIEVNSHPADLDCKIYDTVFESRHESSENVCNGRLVSRNSDGNETPPSAYDSGKSYLDVGRRVSVSTNQDTNDSCQFDGAVESSQIDIDSDFFVQHKEINNVNNSLFKWSSTTLSGQRNKQTRELKRNSSLNCRTSAGSKTSKANRKKSSSERGQQSLLSIFGFAKKDNLQH